VIGAGGVERVIELTLTAEERTMLDASVNSVKGLIDVVKTLDPSLARG
jgi:malate dehydrogenase